MVCQEPGETTASIFNAFSSSGRREVPKSCAQVPGTDIRLHHGLVPALAEGRAHRRRRPLPVAVRDRMHARRQETAHPQHGHHSRRRFGELRRVFSKVRVR